MLDHILGHHFFISKLTCNVDHIVIIKHTCNVKHIFISSLSIYVMLDHFFLKLLMTIHPVWPQVPFGEKRVGAFAVVGAGGWVVLANLETFLVGGLSGLQREVTCMERHAWETWGHARLQALVYVILPSTTAVFSYVIGSRKLSANEQFFVGAQTVVIKFVANNSNRTRRVIYSRQQNLHQHK